MAIRLSSENILFESALKTDFAVCSMGVPSHLLSAQPLLSISFPVIFQVLVDNRIYYRFNLL